MAYRCELGNGHRVYLDNQGTQTIVTSIIQTPGQQQQSSNSFSTGTWTSPPKIYQIAGGIVVKIFTSQGEHYLQLQGSSMSHINNHSNLENAPSLPLEPADPPSISSMPPMTPMQSMQPMKMGDMEMNLKPMEMRMGNMTLKMGETLSKPQNFCSQCGSPVKPEDRFCRSCGTRLQD